MTIKDAVSGDPISIHAIGFKKDLGLDPAIAGRTGVSIEAKSSTGIDPAIELTVEGAVHLAIEVIDAIAQAMHRDPGPWEIDRADWAAIKAALDARRSVLA